MFKKFPFYLGRYSIFPAILFIIPLIIYIRDETFTQTWLLYLDNALFLVYIFIFEFLFFGQQHETDSPVNAGLAVTISGVIISCLLIFLVVAIFAPLLYKVGDAAITLQNKPPDFPKKSEFGVWLILFASAIFGNMVAGAFCSIMSSGILKQTKLPGN